jgi:hypothetical protein
MTHRSVRALGLFVLAVSGCGTSDSGDYVGMAGAGDGTTGGTGTAGGTGTGGAGTGTGGVEATGGTAAGGL